MNSDRARHKNPAREQERKKDQKKEEREGRATLEDAATAATTPLSKLATPVSGLPGGQTPAGIWPAHHPSHGHN